MTSGGTGREPEAGGLRQGAKVSVAIVLCCLWVAILCSAHIDQMFLDGHLGYAGALRGVIGQNYLRRDPLAIRLAPLQNAGPTRDGPPSVRFNHPPLTGMLVGVSFALFGGASEAAARLVPIAASVLTTPLLFGWVRRLWGIEVAITALALWCTAPFVAVFGAMVSYEPLVLCAWMLAIRAWTRWRRGEGRRLPLIEVALAVVVGLWTDWPMAVLASGLVAVEAVHVVRRRPRRPAFLVTTTAALVGGLGALAIYDLAILNVELADVASLYAMRSSLGVWSGWDAAAHIAHRAAVLLTWPLVGAALLGLLAVTSRRSVPLADGAELADTRALLIVGLLVPPLALLLLLPQHAVIHCFSTWYLLPAAVTAGAVAIVGVGRLLARRAGIMVTALVGVVLAAILLWQAVPVVADGWLSDGSPLEGRPRLDYRHLALARWVGERTTVNDELLVDPATGVVGVRAWFQHDRRTRRFDPERSVAEQLAETSRAVALLSGSRLDAETTRRLARRFAVAVVDETVVVDTRRPGRAVEVLELVEERPSWWWVLARSACYPPHRYRHALAREAAYRRPLHSGGRAADVEPLDDGGQRTLTELAALHFLALGYPGVEAREQDVLDAVTVRVDASLCPGLDIVGAVVEASPTGAMAVRVVLRAREALAVIPPISASLTPEDGARRPSQWTVTPDDRLTWPASAFLVCTHRLPAATSSGAYRLVLDACGHNVVTPPLQLERSTALPVMEPVGRL